MLQNGLEVHSFVSCLESFQHLEAVCVNNMFHTVYSPILMFHSLMAGFSVSSLAFPILPLKTPKFKLNKNHPNRFLFTVLCPWNTFLKKNLYDRGLLSIQNDPTVRPVLLSVCQSTFSHNRNRFEQWLFVWNIVFNSRKPL